MYWKGNGFALWMKRLVKSRFQWPTYLPMDVVDLKAQQVNWLYDGYDLTFQSLFIDQLLEQIKLAKRHRFGIKYEVAGSTGRCNKQWIQRYPELVLKTCRSIVLNMSTENLLHTH